MEQDFFTNLPPEITINILSRLPVRTAVSCKSVRKSWRSLIETPEFVKSYKPVPCLAIFQGKTSSKPYKVYELEDEFNLENSKSSCNVVFNFPHRHLIHSSANGLLFLFDYKLMPHRLSVCNPVTGDFIKLPSPQVSTPKWQVQLDTYGFGVSKMTGQYKLVRIYHEVYETEESGHWRLRSQSHCQVYTLGTGLWRSIASCGQLVFGCNTVGASLNGNFHWLASDLKGSPWISCFDFETELFKTLSPPHFEGFHGGYISRTLAALRGCLGLCDNSSKYEIVIWLMNTYGDEKSWTKQFVIAKIKPQSDFYDLMCAVKVFEDGDILITKQGCSELFCYSNKTKTIESTDLIEARRHDRTSVVCYTPSFLPLKTFPKENVSSF